MREQHSDRTPTLRFRLPVERSRPTADQSFIKSEEVRRRMSTRTAWTLLATLVMVAAAALTGLGLAAGSSPPSGHLLGGPLTASSTVTSSNWAGYAALNTAGSTAGTVTHVQGTWVQPSVNCTNGKTTYESMWVGIDGYSSTTVEQTGSDGDCHGGAASYYVWYEFYPAGSVTITAITVHAGDKITGSVTYSSSTGKFTTKITDGSHSFSKTGSVSGAKRSSAEWILETPEICSSTCSLASLSKFTVAKFTDCKATIAGVTGGISAFPQVYKIELKRGTTVLASTSALKSATSFTEKWKAYS